MNLSNARNLPNLNYLSKMLNGAGLFTYKTG